jgi:KRAB domain-containing zinc finger protein
VCRKKYVFQSQLKCHLSEVHRIQYPEMICKICFMEFNTVMEQKAHERKHDKIYSCQYCCAKFASVYLCQKHYEKHLVDVKPYQCLSCGKRFQNSISLGIHHNRHKHSKCLICNAYFVEELELLMHIRTHGIQGKHQFLAAVEELDQEETQLEDMLCVYFKTSTEHHPIAGMDKGEGNV